MFILPFGRTAASADFGSICMAGSIMTRTATMGRPSAAAAVATTCDSMSTAMARVFRNKARFSYGWIIAAWAPTIVPGIAPGIVCSRFRDQASSVACRLSSERIAEPTMQIPDASSGESPPATPKLTRPRQSFPMARSRAAARVRPSLPQTTCVPARAAMRASNAKPTTAMMVTCRAILRTAQRPRKGGHPERAFRPSCSRLDQEIPGPAAQDRRSCRGSDLILRRQ